MDDARIPVTLLTGFLGAGKTTVLNHLLSEEVGQRIAVIVNEFGEAGLDHDLIETSSDDVVLMASGCLCCTVRGELAETIEGLLARRTSGEFEFDRIVIETTGLADPGPILQTMLVERALAVAVKMDGVVTVVDAANGGATLDAQFEAVSQVAMADLIIVSKTDLIPGGQVAAFETRLRAINGVAKLLRAVRGSGLAGQLWGLSGLRKDVEPANALAWVEAKPQAQSLVPSFASAETTPSDPLANLSGLASKTMTPEPLSSHDTRIETASLVLDAPLVDHVFDGWLNKLVARRGPNLLRVKGIIFLEGIETPFVFHGVQQIFDPPIAVQDWPKDDRRSRIVVIARDIPLSELESSFDMLRPTANP